MKKKLVLGMAVMAVSGALFAGCGTTTYEPIIGEDGSVTIPAGCATFTEGVGVNSENEQEDTYFDADAGLIKSLATDGEIVYEVPEGVDGTYDIYLEASKMLVAFSSQPFTFSVNGGDVFSVPMAIEVPADSTWSYTDDGSYDTGVLDDKGYFPIKTGVEFHAGDTITVTAKFGGKGGSLNGMAYPGVGNLLLAVSGTEVATGYDNTVKAAETVDETDPLSGLNMIWIGSSVTYGMYSGGNYSMADAIQDNHAGTVCEKYAISATTLVNTSESSYVSRLKLIDKDKTPDVVVVQLSTNDATTGKEFGHLADGFELEDFDDTTIYGAIESIIAYVKETFGCPVVFYTGTYCEKENYSEMVDALHEIQEKWGIGVIDMFNNEEMTALYGTEQYNVYMHDEVHPYRVGYTEWWTPVIEQELSDYLETVTNQ
jgi:lysophospholipase L1-like esterase